MDRDDTSPWSMCAAAAVVAVLLALSNMPTPFYVRWQAAIGFPSATLTVLFSAYIVGLIASLAITGGLVVRLGPRPILLSGCFLSIVACAVFVAARSEWALVLARLLSGFGVGTAITAGLPWVVGLGGPRRSAVALPLASGAVAAGAGVGPVLAGTLSLFSARPVQIAFGCELALLALASVVVAVLANKVDPDTRFKVPSRLLPTVTSAEAPHLLRAVAGFGCALGATAFLLSLGPSVLRSVVGVDDPLVAGAMASSMFMAGAAAQVPGRLASVRALSLLAGLAIVLAATGIAASIILRSPYPILAGAILAGAGYGLAQLAGLRLISLYVKEGRRPEANALLNIGAYIPCGLLPILIGLVVDSQGLVVGTFAFAAAIAAITVVVTALTHRGLPGAG